ncbi:MAG: hypothetical protein CME20_03450 [Gemmatimonadetes bacterium]|nr:hypothetical protein [Gemmatimonadota bacterium]
MASQQQVDQYRDQGYFIADDAVAPEMLEEMIAAAQRATAKVRSGEIVDDPAGVRTGGTGDDATFISGLMAPEFGEPVFAEYLGSEALARYLQPFIGDELRLGWVHLCVVEGDYEIGWHRDTGGNDRDGSYEVEMDILARHRSNFMKWHLALADDPCLWIVPGSQRRYRTDREREVLINDPRGEIPDGQQIDLKRGQTIFWNSNTIHRGLKPDDVAERWTVMCALIDHRTAYDDHGEKGDHQWLMADNIREALPERTRHYYDNWRALAEPRMAAGG